MGTSTAMVMGTGINLISEVVGGRGKEGAFVFGVYSFADKCIVGIIGFLVINGHAFRTENPTPDDISHINMVTTVIPGIGCLLATLSVVFYPIPEYEDTQYD